MEYQVPQFIEVEDKIVGPLTLKQFIYIAGGAGLCVIIVLYLPLIFAILLCIPVAALAGALAFYKVNGKDFTQLLEAAAGYYTGGKLFLWKHEVNNPSDATIAANEATRVRAVEANRTVALPKLSRSKLRDLAWSLDVQDKKQQ